MSSPAISRRSASSSITISWRKRSRWRKQEGEGGDAAQARDWTPQITIDAAALIPAGYIEDLDLRLTMYRRLASLEEAADVEAFAAELIDRFGPLPDETEQLLKLIGIKQLCRQAGVAKVDAGPKGMVLAFPREQLRQARASGRLDRRE